MNKTKQKAEREVKRIIKKLVNDKKALREMAIATKGFMKFNGQEMKALLNHMKRVEDNTRWSTLREVFGKIYLELDKEKKRLDKFGRKYKKEGNKKQERQFTKAILTVGINVENNIVRRLEREIRKKYGYWKVKKPKKMINNNARKNLRITQK